jgi:predicted nucleotidyltransferase
MVNSAIVSAVRRYLCAVSSEGIHARRAVLFGSLARGEGDEWSDIDLVVIAPEFDVPCDVTQVEALWRATLAADNRIEPIPCGEREWETDETRPILEIARREGIVIADRGLSDDNERA